MTAHAADYLKNVECNSLKYDRRGKNKMTYKCSDCITEVEENEIKIGPITGEIYCLNCAKQRGYKEK